MLSACRVLPVLRFTNSVLDGLGGVYRPYGGYPVVQVTDFCAYLFP